MPDDKEGFSLNRVTEILLASKEPRTQDCVMCGMAFVPMGTEYFCGDGCRKRRFSERLPRRPGRPVHAN